MKKFYLVSTTFKLDEIYVVWFFFNRRTLCKFVKSTEKGYNFINLKTGKFLLKNHLYYNKKNVFMVSGNMFYSTVLTSEDNEAFKTILRGIKIKKIINKEKWNIY